MDDERRLLIRGFPHWLKGSEKESLLQHFGAKEVVNMPSRGKMVCAIQYYNVSIIIIYIIHRETVYLLLFLVMKMPRG